MVDYLADRFVVMVSDDSDADGDMVWRMRMEAIAGKFATHNPHSTTTAVLTGNHSQVSTDRLQFMRPIFS